VHIELADPSVLWRAIETFDPFSSDPFGTMMQVNGDNDQQSRGEQGTGLNPLAAGREDRSDRLSPRPDWQRDSR
jgi:hypothetical protein